MKNKVSFATAPEHYAFLPSTSFENKSIVKSLFIPFDDKLVPKVVTDTPSKTIYSLFQEEKPYCLFFKDNFHMYISPVDQLLGKHINYIATFLARQKYMQSNGYVGSDIICGNVILFGTLNLKTNKIDNKDYSVPYSTVEEVVKIYDTKKYNKTHIY